MKELLLKTLVITFVVLGMASCSKDRVETNELKTMKDSVSYAIGLNMGQAMHAEGFELDMDIMVKALTQGFNNDTIGAMNPSQLQDIMMKYQQGLESKKQDELSAKLKTEEKTNRPKSEKFLAENKTKQGVITKESGLQYEVIAQGKGAKLINPKDRIKLHLRLSDLGGKVYTNTFEQGQELILTSIEGLEMNFPFLESEIKDLSVGSHVKYWISPDLTSQNGQSDGNLIIIEMKIEELIKE